jgi:hypothetical protein
MSEDSILEEEASIRLDDNEMDKLITTLERFISNQDDEENSFILIGNLCELSDQVPNIKTGYYGSFDKLIRRTRQLLIMAREIAKNDTIKSLIEDCIDKVSKTMDRLGIEVEEPEKDVEPEYYKYSKYKYPYKKYYYKRSPKNIETKLSEDLGIEIGQHLQNKSSDPHYTDNDREDIKNSVMDQMSLEYEGKIKHGDDYPEAILVWNALMKLQHDKEDLKARTEELSNIKKNERLELSNQKDLDNLRLKLLYKCIDGMIAEAQEQ